MLNELINGLTLTMCFIQALSEEQNRSNELQMQLAGKDANIDLMRMEIKSHSVDSASLYSGDTDASFSVTGSIVK